MKKLENLRQFNFDDNDFYSKFGDLIKRGEELDHQITNTVREIINNVRKSKDEAVLRYSKQFDSANFSSVACSEILQAEALSAFESLSSEKKSALEKSLERIRRYHEMQTTLPFSYQDEFGSKISMQVTPLERVGIYVPGGKASYPSTVLMNAIPAAVAGVEEVIMVVPSNSRGEVNQMTLAAAHLAGISRLFRIGGAHAIAALAYGTETIPRVDMIVGPGNAYVAEAKRQVFGSVGIDMVAGPSEILIISDGSGDPEWVAMDLFSQAEHDELAQAILLCTSRDFMLEVRSAIKRLLPQMDRSDIIETSLVNRGALIFVEDLSLACELANKIAPEHLELAIEEGERWLPYIRNAGSIFVGKYSSESLGDYCAGPNHVLPTSGSARFSSALSVYDFKKRTSIINVSPTGAKFLGKIASTIAKGEGLTAHAKSAEMRYVVK